MSSFNKVDFLKALENDGDFARDIATLLAPHLIEVLEINTSQNENGNIEYISIDIDENKTSDKLINTIPFYREVEKVAHALWAKFESDKRNYPSRSVFVRELQNAVLEDLNSDLPNTITETEVKFADTLIFFKRTVSNFHASCSDAKELVTKVKYSIEKYRKSVKVIGL